MDHVATRSDLVGHLAAPRACSGGFDRWRIEFRGGGGLASAARGPPKELLYLSSRRDLLSFEPRDRQVASLLGPGFCPVSKISVMKARYVDYFLVDRILSARQRASAELRRFLLISLSALSSSLFFFATSSRSSSRSRSCCIRARV